MLESYRWSSEWAAGVLLDPHTLYVVKSYLTSHHIKSPECASCVIGAENGMIAFREYCHLVHRQRVEKVRKMQWSTTCIATLGSRHWDHEGRPVRAQLPTSCRVWIPSEANLTDRTPCVQT
jgi:hypothetical protein